MNKRKAAILNPLIGALHSCIWLPGTKNRTTSYSTTGLCSTTRNTTTTFASFLRVRLLLNAALQGCHVCHAHSERPWLLIKFNIKFVNVIIIIFLFVCFFVSLRNSFRAILTNMCDLARSFSHCLPSKRSLYIRCHTERTSKSSQVQSSLSDNASKAHFGP